MRIFSCPQTVDLIMCAVIYGINFSLVDMQIFTKQRQKSRIAGKLMGRKKKLINNSDIPQNAIETIARCLLPDIIAFFESEEGQREFAEWKRQQEEKKDIDDEKNA